MMKKIYKSEKGINLISLTLAVMVILIITAVTLYNVKDNLGVQNLKNMQTDIGNLRDKISDYYAQYGGIPADTRDESVMKYTNIEQLKEDGIISDAVDTGAFYVIDLSAMDNVTLTYGTDYKEIYEKIKNEEEVTNEYVNTLEDLYIINEVSHNIFYVKGIMLDKEIFYTDYTEEDVDSKRVELQYENEVNVTEEIWSPTYEQSSIYKDENEDTAHIPAGFQVSRKTVENAVFEGLVIQKADTKDRYVWIQVPRTVFKTATSETDYEGIENDLKEYTVDYVQDGYEDSYYERCGIETESEYNELKNKMLSSIYNNGGFWISQYEIGTSEQRTNVTTATASSSSKEGEYPYNYVTIEQAQEIANSKLNSEEYSCSLIFGLQWDLVLKFIETTKAKTQEEIVTDSTPWGNYKNSEFNITKGKYGITSWQDVNENFSKLSTDGVMLSTGATNRNSALNIYDLAGNMEEWTLEKNTTNDKPYVTRGGSYIDDIVNDVNESYVSKRNTPTVDIYSGDSYIGFRAAIY